MNSIIQSLQDRKSVRAYTGEAIPEADVQAILTAATQAPSGGNQQLYTILRVDDQEKKHRLSETCDHQPFIEQASLVLIFCADCLRWYNAYRAAGCAPRKPGPGDMLLASIDAAIAAQNAVTAAQALGIGSCYIGDILENIEAQREILSLPVWVVPSVMVVFGYPTAQQQARPKPQRFDMKYIVQQDGYHALTDDELRDMFARRAGAQGFDAWVKAFAKRKYESDFAREMSRSVSLYLKDFSGD